jgi:Ca2+-binding RTX toxin-like protein
LDVFKVNNIDVSVTAANAGTNNTITLAGSATGSNNRTFTMSTANTFEGLNLDVSGASKAITLTNYPLTKASVFKDADSVNVTRAQNFTLTGTPASGTLKIGSIAGTLTNVGSGGLSLTGGANNDTFTISGDWTGALSLNGAGGTGNALLFTSNAAAIDLNPATLVHGANTINHASVQKVTLNGGAAAQNFDVSDWTSGGTINAAGGTDTITLNGKDDASLKLTSGSLSYGANKWTFSSIENAEITTGGADNTIDAKGWQGTTTIDSGAGNDIIIGGQGADDLDGNAGNDFIYGGNGNDTIVGAGGKDLIVAGDGADKVDLVVSSGENAGDDLLIAGTTIYDSSATTGKTQIDIFNAFRNAWAGAASLAAGKTAVFTTGVTVGGTNHKLSVNLASTPTVQELNSVLDDGDVDQLDGGASTGDLGYYENSTGTDKDTVAGFDDFFDVL